MLFWIVVLLIWIVVAHKLFVYLMEGGKAAQRKADHILTRAHHRMLRHRREQQFKRLSVRHRR